MAVERRKDNKNRVLKEGEYQRTSGMFFARPFCIKLQKLFVGRCSCIL